MRNFKRKEQKKAQREAKIRGEKLAKIMTDASPQVKDTQVYKAYRYMGPTNFFKIMNSKNATDVEVLENELVLSIDDNRVRVDISEIYFTEISRYLRYVKNVNGITDFNELKLEDNAKRYFPGEEREVSDSNERSTESGFKFKIG